MSFDLRHVQPHGYTIRLQPREPLCTEEAMQWLQRTEGDPD